MDMRNKFFVLLLPLLLTACGGGGGSDSGGSSVKNDTPPSLTLGTDTLSLDENSETSISISASDADGDNITISTQSDITELALSNTNNTLTINAGEVYGETSGTISVTASAKGKTVSKTISIVVNDTDTPPTLTSLNNVELQERQTIKVAISASDADGDEIELTASSDSEQLTVSNTNSELSISVGRLEADLETSIILTATANGKTVKKTIQVLAKNLPDNPPTLELDPPLLSIKEATSVTIMIVANDIDDDEMTITSSTSSDLLTVSNTDTELTVTASEIDNEVTEEVVVAVTANGVTTSKNLQVTITNNQAPTITLAGVDEHNVVTIYTDEAVTIPVILNDADGDQVTWGLAEEFRSSFEEDHSNNPLRGVRNYHFDTENNVINIELDTVPAGSALKYNTFLWVNDGTEVVRTDFYIQGENRPNGAPVLRFDDQVIGGRVPVDIGSTTVVNYEIIDDNPEAIEFGEFVISSGDASKFILTHNKQAQTISITYNGTQSGEELVFGLPFTDVSSSGTFFLTAISRPAWSEWHDSMMAYVTEGRQKLAAGKEYAHIAAFYADVLENTGLITGLQAEEYRKRALVNDSHDLDLFVLLRSLNVIEEYVTLGRWVEGDEVATVSTVEYRFGTLFLHYGKQAQAVVEELVTKSGNQLVSLPFIDSVHKYDADNSYFSHFTSDATYGSTVDGKWVFKEEYRFLQAIIEKTRSEITNAYVEE